MKRVGNRGVASLAAVLCGLMATQALAAQQSVELPGRDRMLEPAVQEVFTVGTFDGADWETFGQVRQVAFDGAGNLYILDSQTSRFIIVDRNGEFVRMWGKEGEGPGEWRSAAGAAVFRDGTVAIADMGHGSYQVFDAAGAFLGTAPLRDGPVTRVGRIQPDPRGGALFNGGGNTMMSVSFDGGPGARPEMPEGRPVERIILGESPAKEVFYSAWEAPRGDPNEMNAGGVRMMMMPEPRIFSPDLHTAALPDGGMALVDSSAYAVKILDENGRVARVVSRDIDPIEVTDRIERNEIQRQLDELESGEGPRMRIVTDDGGGAREMPQEQVKQMMRQRIQNRGFYPEIAVARRLAAGWSGLVWLERRQVDPTAAGPIDVFSPEGEYVGTINEEGPRIPDAFGPDGLVAYIDEDEFEVPIVVVRRLPENLR
jgi:hypothetical protein